MTAMPAAALVSCVVALLVGSFPTAFLVGKVNGVDLRRVGSGNLGATNVLRTLGWKWGALVYLVDFAKGYLPVAFLPVGGLTGADATPWRLAFGVLAILGHVRPVFLLGQGGGKGVATASGVFFALAPDATLAAIVAFAIVVAVTRYVSLGSLVGAVVLTAMLFLRRPGALETWLGLLVSVFVFWTHRENIGRLMRGEERRLGGAPSGTGARS
ncbi:MAG: glycerol-3-phosphate 1-O-acyltransferase PlsY [Gemmatimonadetes bacterium]|nr:glycerol-3-phosphate 1-O-acyltransferase PlsY [Gemmatimonadota bacterium]